MQIKRFSMVAGACLLLLGACKESSHSGKEASSLPEGAKFLDPANMDTTVRAGDNFYMYVNGAWLKNTPIPASETSWGSFNLLDEFNLKALKGLMEEAASTKDASKGSPEQMVGDMFASGMDTMAIEKEGLSGLQPELDKINAITSPAMLVDELARRTSIGLNPLFAFYVGPDDKNVSKNICNLFQGGLGLPDRDYYLKQEPKETKIREQYLQHITAMLKLSGESEADAAKHAQTIMAMETGLAKVSMDRVAMRDPYLLYNKFSLADFSKKTIGMNWADMFAKMNVNGQDSIIVGQPAFMTYVADLIAKAPLDDWKVYLKWHALSDMASYLPKAYDIEHFNFYGKVLRGQQEQRPRWKRVLQVVDGSVGEQLGKMYTDKYFTADAKKRMLELVDNLQKVYEERINQLDWMSDSTKVKAKEKLYAFIKKIGYPDKWRDYTGLEVDRTSYFKNILASNRFDFKFMTDKLSKPVDKTEWGMTPPTVNAYYNPAFNEIVFPAGILQYPFFEKNADDAVIYGAIGCVIGHEMTHGFDDQGCEYAADGNLKNWWNEADKKNFQAKTTMVKDQFDAYTVLDGKHVNGALTLGENIADLGGITIAYEAFKKTKQGQSQEKIDGFTPDQRFFMSWAQVWRTNIREEEVGNRLVTDPHSPAIHRVNGPLSNFAPFYEAFGIKEGDKMFKPEAQRAKVW